MVVLPPNTVKTIINANQNIKNQDEDDDDDEDDDEDDDDEYEDGEEGEDSNVNEDQKVKTRQLGFIIDKLNQLYSNHTSYRNYLQKAKNELNNNKGIIN